MRALQEDSNKATGIQAEMCPQQVVVVNVAACIGTYLLESEVCGSYSSLCLKKCANFGLL